MADLKKFLVAVAILTTKDEVFSCPTRSHNAGSYPCTPSLSHSTSNLHHSSATTVPCNSASRLISSSSNLPNSLTLPFKSTFTQDTLPAPASFQPPSPHVYSSNYLDLLNILNNILSSPPNIVSSVPQISPANQFALPNLPVSNIVRGPVKTQKPHKLHSSHASLSGSGPCSSGILPGLPNGLIPPLIVTPSPSLKFPFLTPVLNATSFNILVDNTEHLNTLQKPLSDVPSPTDVPSNTPKVIPLSQLCAKFMPTFNKSSLPVSDSTSLNISHYNPPSNDSLSSILPGVRSCDPSSSSMPKVSGAVPESPLKERLVPTSVSTLTPKPTSIPTTELASSPALTLNSSTACGGRNPAIKNIFHKHLLSTQAPKGPHVSPPRLTLSPPCVKTTLNAASLPGVSTKPRGTSLGCVTSPGSSLLPKPAFMTPPLISTPTPTLNTGVSSGYNPAFMQLLVNRLISNPNSPLPSLSSSLPYLRPSLNITPMFSSSQNIFQTPALNGSTYDFNTNIFNVSYYKPSESTLAPGSTTTAIANTSLCNNPAFTSMLCKLLSSSFATSKTLFPACLSPTNGYPISLSNTTSVSSV